MRRHRSAGTIAPGWTGVAKNLLGLRTAIVICSECSAQVPCLHAQYCLTTTIWEGAMFPSYSATVRGAIGILSAVSIWLFAMAPADAACISSYVRYEYGVCKVYVQNSCGKMLRCFINVSGYASSNGQLYSDGGTVIVYPGRTEWYGIGRVSSCGASRYKCE